MQKRAYDKDHLANRARKRGVVSFPILIFTDWIAINFPDDHDESPRPALAQQRLGNSPFATLSSTASFAAVVIACKFDCIRQSLDHAVPSSHPEPPPGGLRCGQTRRRIRTRPARYAFLGRMHCGRRQVHEWLHPRDETGRPRPCEMRSIGFHGRNHGRRFFRSNHGANYFQNYQRVKLVGAVGIEPTTSPV
jgi:hypothetical protein